MRLCLHQDSRFYVSYNLSFLIWVFFNGRSIFLIPSMYVKSEFWRIWCSLNPKHHQNRYEYILVYFEISHSFNFLRWCFGFKLHQIRQKWLFTYIDGIRNILLAFKNTQMRKLRSYDTYKWEYLCKQARRFIENPNKNLALNSTWHRYIHWAHWWEAKIWSKKDMTLIFFPVKAEIMLFSFIWKRRPKGGFPFAYFTLKFCNFAIFTKSISQFQSFVDKRVASFGPPFL